MIPVEEQPPTELKPYVNWGLVITNMVVFLYLLFFVVPGGLVDKFGLVPAAIMAGTGHMTLITSMFLHGNIFHIAGNMLYLWIFGDNIEDQTGHLDYAIFYTASGIAASFVYMASNPFSTIPAIGASGAVSGVLGAYVIRFPQERVSRTMFGHLVRLPIFILILVWFFYQLILSALNPTGGVAYFAHIGGFVAGLLIAVSIPRTRKRDPLPQ